MKIPTYLDAIRHFIFCARDVPVLRAEIEHLHFEIAEAHTVREVTEKHFFEVRAELARLRQERDELAAALQWLNRLVVRWWLREIAEVGE